MIKQEVLAAWENRMFAAQSKIEEDLESSLEKLRYEQEIAQRLLAKAQDETAQQDWRIQVDVLHMMLVSAENDMAEQEKDVALCEAMIAEIEADLEIEATE